jgi:hypothetical protein
MLAAIIASSATSHRLSGRKRRRNRDHLIQKLTRAAKIREVGDGKGE